MNALLCDIEFKGSCGLDPVYGEAFLLAYV